MQCVITQFVEDFEQDDGSETSFYDNLISKMPGAADDSPRITLNSFRPCTLPTTILQQGQHGPNIDSLATVLASDQLITYGPDAPPPPDAFQVLTEWLKAAGRKFTEIGDDPDGHNNPFQLCSDIDHLIYVTSNTHPDPGWKTPAEYNQQTSEGTPLHDTEPRTLFTKVLSLSNFNRLVKMTLDQELQGHAAPDHLRGECKAKAPTVQILPTSHANDPELLDNIQDTQQWSDEALD
jgi:hypothetical protein